ncbi:MAG: L-threonine 3-dehydrogenase [Chloroflexota bacterium]
MPTDELMFALKKLVAEPGLTWRGNAQAPVAGPRDVVVKVTMAGLCGTDRHIYEWDEWSASRVPLGITIGHEFVGRVAAVGNAARRAKVGDRVTGEGHIGCGVCQPCRTGNGHICEAVDIIGVDCDGCFAQYVRLPEENVWPVHDRIPDRIATIFDPLGNAMHTVTAAGVSGRSVLITGVGVIGLMATAIARAAGAGSIIAVDIDPRRLAQALEFGADHAFLATDPDWPAEVRRLTDRQGPEVLLEMSGSSAAIRGGFRALRNGGTAALLGLPSRPVELDLPNDIIFKGAKVLGINGRRMYETWYQVEGFLLSGRLDVGALISHTLPIDEFDRAFKLLQSAEATKVILSVSDGDLHGDLR